MAKFLDKEKAVAQLKELIITADKRLLLISPYIHLTDDVKHHLTWRNKKGKKTNIIFRKKEVKADVLQFLRGLEHLTMRECENLHAKCYVSDQKIIITSLNLLESSVNKNMEMGVLIDKNDPVDAVLYRDALFEAGLIFDRSQELEFDSGKAVKTPAKPAKSDEKHYGYCIRTGVEIPFDVIKPLSYSAYRQWNEYGNGDYEEKFCHFSGEPSFGETTYDKPILSKNWKKAKAMFGL